MANPVPEDEGNACHGQGIEVWGSLRMNDIHDSFMGKTLEDSAEPIKEARTVSSSGFLD